LKVLLSGSFVEKKGLPYAFRALGRVKANADLKITVIGDDNGGNRSKQEKAAILSAVADGGLDSNTRFLGYQPYSVLMKEAYNHHLFLSPSVSASDGDTEGGAPVTIIEMAASGMPIVSSVHCDIPEVIKDGESGLLAPERDFDELAGKLSWLIENPDQWSAMVGAARKHIEIEFDSNIQGERLAGQYLSLLKRDT
jgi:colanic acid/amylovoran biosynthesis glycosyltransferase